MQHANDTKKACLILTIVLAAVTAGCAGSPVGNASSGAATSPGESAKASGGTHSYYVDCSQSSNGNGTESSPWNNIASANGHSYSAGDTIYFKTGMTCNGMFSPSGSGKSSAPITVTDYGTGALPILDGGSTNNAAFYLTNQSYWTIENLYLQGGENWGLVAKALSGNTVTGLTITNVTATGATLVSTQRAVGGEIGLITDKTSSSTISNVNLSYVTAENTTAGEGIFIQAGQHGAYTGPKGQNISVTNSHVDNVYGDGLLVTDAENVTLSNNVVTQSGECPNCTGSTPGALWVWNTIGAEISQNESYDNTSWAGDGGGIDIDYLNRNITVERNYIHDNKGYCVSVFGAGSEPTVNSIIRFNVCVNNDAESTSINYGDFLLSTWNSGSLNGVEIYDNTSYWTATPTNTYELTDKAATFSGSNPDFFENNIVYTPLTTPYLIDATKLVTADYNLYYGPNATQYSFEYGGTTYTSLATYQSATGQDANSLISNPLLPEPSYDVANVWPTTQFTPQSGSPAIGGGTDVCTGISGCSMGTTDFLGNPLPTTGYWIGAIE